MAMCFGARAATERDVGETKKKNANLVKFGHGYNIYGHFLAYSLVRFHLRCALHLKQTHNFRLEAAQRR